MAFFNARNDSAVAIGVDADGVDWRTAGYWASLRAQHGNPVPFYIKCVFVLSLKEKFCQMRSESTRLAALFTDAVCGSRRVLLFVHLHARVSTHLWQIEGLH